MAEEAPNDNRTPPLLEILESTDWRHMRQQMEERTYEPGDLIVAQGTVEPDFQIVLEGVASVSAASPRGQRLELSRLGRGDCIGEMALLTGEPASANIVAITPVRTRGIAMARLAALDEERGRLMEAISVMLATRLKRANDRLMAMRQAAVHVVQSATDDGAAIARLPRELARATSGKVLLMVSGEPFAGTAFRDAVSGEDVSLEVLQPDDLSDLPGRLHLLAHDYDHIVLMLPAGTVSGLMDGVDTRLDLVRVGRVALTSNGPESNVVIVSEQPWTRAVIKDFSSRLGRPVLGILPPGSHLPAASRNVAKLARVLSGRQVGVALGAGAAKGFAHTGVLRALDEMGIPVDVISGSSIGAAFAAGWANGMSADELAEAGSRIAARAIRPALPLHSFLSNKGIRDELRKIAGNRRFDEVEIPLAIVATDIYRRCDVTFTSGKIWPCILASMAIPGIYPPVKARGSYLVDGGVLNPVPARQARDLGAGIVIGVRLTGKATSPRDELEREPARPLATETITRSLEIMNNRISEMSKDQADVTIEVSLEGGGIGDFRQGQQYMQAGYEAVMEAADQIRDVIPYATDAA